MLVKLAYDFWGFFGGLILGPGISYFYLLSLPRPQSIAITFWGILELIIKESGDERTQMHSALISHHPPLALLTCLQLSHFSLVPCSH